MPMFICGGLSDCVAENCTLSADTPIADRVIGRTEVPPTGTLAAAKQLLKNGNIDEQTYRMLEAVHAKSTVDKGGAHIFSNAKPKLKKPFADLSNGALDKATAFIHGDVKMSGAFPSKTDHLSFRYVNRLLHGEENNASFQEESKKQDRKRRTTKVSLASPKANEPKRARNQPVEITSPLSPLVRSPCGLRPVPQSNRKAEHWEYTDEKFAVATKELAKQREKQRLEELASAKVAWRKIDVEQSAAAEVNPGQVEEPPAQAAAPPAPLPRPNAALARKMVEDAHVQLQQLNDMPSTEQDEYDRRAVAHPEVVRL
jgi:hypothetical protein